MRSKSEPLQGQKRQETNRIRVIVKATKGRKKTELDQNLAANIFSFSLKMTFLF